jgi:hypothetical protein
MLHEERLDKLEKQVEFIISATFGGPESPYKNLYKAIVGEDMPERPWVRSPNVVIKDDV